MSEFEYVRTMSDEWLAVVAQGEPRLCDGCRANRAAAAARDEMARRAEAKARRVH